MANGEVFTTVMRGYKKDEVLEYVANLNAQLVDLKEQLQKKEAELERAKAEQTQVSESEVQEREAALKAEIEATLRAEMELQKEQAVAAEVAEKTEEMRLQAETYRTKAEEYDAQRSAIAEIMLEARRNADDVMNRARTEAEAIRLSALARFDELGAAFAVMRSNMQLEKSDIHQRLEQIKMMLQSFDDKMDQMEKTIDSSKGEFTGENV